MFLLAILTPLIMTAALLLPSYAAIFGATYIIYMPAAGAHPLMPHVLDVFYIIDVYSQLITYWMAHQADVSFVHYTLPVVALPLFGTLLALWLTYRLSRGLAHLFRMSSTGN